MLVFPHLGYSMVGHGANVQLAWAYGTVKFQMVLWYLLLGFVISDACILFYIPRQFGPLRILYCTWTGEDLEAALDVFINGNTISFKEVLSILILSLRLKVGQPCTTLTWFMLKFLRAWFNALVILALKVGGDHEFGWYNSCLLSHESWVCDLEVLW
jgi:hypothetical protein